jgi:hypothetical protein
MFVVQPVTDCPIAETNGAGELLDTPLPSWVIRFPAWPRSSPQMPNLAAYQSFIESGHSGLGPWAYLFLSAFPIINRSFPGVLSSLVT